MYLAVYLFIFIFTQPVHLQLKCMAIVWNKMYKCLLKLLLIITTKQYKQIIMFLHVFIHLIPENCRHSN